MKEIQKVVQKLSREQEYVVGGGGAGGGSAGGGGGVRTGTKHKVTPGIPGWLNKGFFISELCYREVTVRIK